jgi:hypothetical protein
VDLRTQAAVSAALEEALSAWRGVAAEGLAEDSAAALTAAAWLPPAIASLSSAPPLV